MSDRPKIRIVKKGDVTPPEKVIAPTPPPAARNSYREAEPVVETKKAEVLKEEIPQENKSHQNAPLEHYDDFAKPFPWLKTILISVGIIALLSVAYFFVVPMFGSSDNEEENPIENTDNIPTNYDANGVYIKDLLPKGSEKLEDILATNMTLRELLEKIGIPKSDVNALENEGNKYSIRRLKAGDKYTIAHEKDNPSEILMVMIEPKTEPYSFYKLDAAESLTVEKMDKQVEIRENYIAAIVEGTLGQTFIDNNLNLKLISSIEEVLAWTIDLFDVGDGDRFKVLYDEEFVNGKSNKIDKIKALYFEKDGKPYYAFNYNDGEKGFYSEFGQSMKRSFLTTPIKYGGVITSGFGLRVHPVTGHTKEHLGTDFAAPEGTPIQAVADGVIIIATFTANNGNYIKIKHDKTYTTQYLHMQKFADDIRQGSSVKQGQIIGYVGTTGMSTGPHVCYRFWKNEQQEDPSKENANSGSRIATKLLPSYNEYIDPLRLRIKEINYF